MITDNDEAQHLAGDTKMFMGDEYRYQIRKDLTSKIQNKNSSFFSGSLSQSHGKDGS